jgi:hypothetical protein
MMRALWPSPGFKKIPVVPALHVVQNNFYFHKADCRALSRLSDLSYQAELPIFFPQVLGFRLVMRAVTDPSFPEPIWNALQVRNEITQYGPIFEGDMVKLELMTDSQRFLEKGAEVDFKIIASKNNTKIWESLTTFYYRGRYRNGSGSPVYPPELSSVPGDSFRLQDGGGLRYGGISGDYNGIHLWAPYAKNFSDLNLRFFILTEWWVRRSQELNQRMVSSLKEFSFGFVVPFLMEPWLAWPWKATQVD